MPELIDKKRTEAKVFLIARLFIDRPDREVELVKAVIHRCCEEIDKQPTIEAEPVRHGRWVFQKGDKKETCDGWICTNCKYGFHTKVPYFEAFKYCPMCGARMDAEDINVAAEMGGAGNG